MICEDILTIKKLFVILENSHNQNFLHNTLVFLITDNLSCIIEMILLWQYDRHGGNGCPLTHFGLNMEHQKSVPHEASKSSLFDISASITSDALLWPR